VGIVMPNRKEMPKEDFSAKQMNGKCISQQQNYFLVIKWKDTWGV
jgi:hypothetical protein